MDRSSLADDVEGSLNPGMCQDLYPGRPDSLEACELDFVVERECGLCDDAAEFDSLEEADMEFARAAGLLD